MSEENNPSVTSRRFPSIPPADVQFGTSWNYDFKMGDFVLTENGKIPQTDSRTAFFDWCYKTLITPRGKHVIYPPQHGSEFYTLIEIELQPCEIEREIRRMTTEAVIDDPRTIEVGSFSFRWDGNVVTMTCVISSVRGDSALITVEVVTAGNVAPFRIKSINITLHPRVGEV
jgi:hypothetical protein